MGIISRLLRLWLPKITGSHVSCISHVGTPPFLVVMSSVHEIVCFQPSDWHTDVRYDFDISLHSDNGSEKVLDRTRRWSVSYLGPPDLPFPWLMLNLHDIQWLWQVALLTGSKVSICERISTHYTVWYCFLACTRPPDTRWIMKKQSHHHNRSGKTLRHRSRQTGIIFRL